MLNILKDEVVALEDPYSAWEGTCKLDLIHLAQNREQGLSDSSMYHPVKAHPTRSRVHDLRVSSDYTRTTL